jgi:hypothetical protein
MPTAIPTSADSAVEPAASIGNNVPDERPRPEYGEYATPEQQAAAMGKRPIPPLRRLPEMPAAAQSDRLAQSGIPPQPEMPAQPNAADRVFSRGLPRNHPVDRTATFILLGLGLFSLLNSAPTYLAFPQTLAAYATSLSMPFHVPASASAAGIGILVAQIILFVIALAFSVRRVRSGRIAFWIPLVGYAVFIIAASIIVLSVVPTFATLLQEYLSTKT